MISHPAGSCTTQARTTQACTTSRPRTQALGLIADSALTPLRLSTYDVLWMVDMDIARHQYSLSFSRLWDDDGVASSDPDPNPDQL